VISAALLALASTVASAGTTRLWPTDDPSTRPRPGARGRLAIVVDNHDYRGLGELPEADEDRRALVASLRSARFEVEVHENLVDSDMSALPERIAAQMDGVQVGLLYVRGYATHRGNVNHLLGTDLTEVKGGGIGAPADRLLSAMGRAGVAIGVVVFDASGPEGLPGGGRDAHVAGLAQMGSDSSQFWLTFTDRPGATRVRAGLYARTLAGELRRTDRHIGQILEAVRSSVRDATKLDQTPAIFVSRPVYWCPQGCEGKLDTLPPARPLGEAECLGIRSLPRDAPELRGLLERWRRRYVLPDGSAREGVLKQCHDDLERRWNDLPRRRVGRIDAAVVGGYATAGQGEPAARIQLGLPMLAETDGRFQLGVVPELSLWQPLSDGAGSTELQVGGQAFVGRRGTIRSSRPLTGADLHHHGRDVWFGGYGAYALTRLGDGAGRVSAGGAITVRWWSSQRYRLYAQARGGARDLETTPRAELGLQAGIGFGLRQAASFD